MKLFDHKKQLMVLSFFILAVLSVMIMAMSGRALLLSSADAPFHWQRISELRNALINFNLPRVALNNYNADGSAVMTMYPYITLMPFAIFSIFIKSIIWVFYFTFAMYSFVTMLIAFYSSRTFFNDVRASYLFAVIYGLLSNLELANTDYGENLVIIFLPLAVFGMVAFIKHGKWIELSIGFSLILLSNLLAVILVGLLFMLLLGINFKKLNYSHFINLGKSIGLSLLTCSLFILPFLELISMNDMYIPNFFWPPSSIFNEIQDSLNFNAYVSTGKNMSYIATLTIFIGIFFIKKLHGYDRQFYIIGSGLFLFYSFTPVWKLLSAVVPFIKAIQFPTRFYYLSQILLMIVFVLIICEYVDYRSDKQQNLVCKMILLLALFSQLSLQFIYTNKYLSSNSGQDVISRENDSYYYNNRSDVVNEDYYPKKSIIMADLLKNGQGLYDYDKRINVKSNGNGNFEFNVPQDNINELNLPFLFYNGIDYDVNLDGRSIVFHGNKTSLMTINNISKGNHVLKISTKNGFYNIIGDVMFILSIGIYIRLWLKRFNTNRLS